ncbi:MAG: iron-sulfur cluster assembly scaffold protein [Burkholderiaceae bacterium]
MAGTVYSAAVQEHFRHPRHAGRFPDALARVFTGSAGTPHTGGIIRLQIRLDESGIIRETRFKAYGCGATIASGSYVADTVIGLSVDSAGELSSQTIAQQLELQPIKWPCAILAVDALKAAIANYKESIQE